MNKATVPPLSAHQTQFVETWTSSKNRKFAMAWPAGAGSVAAIGEVVRTLGTNTRVLLIADRIEFAHQFLHRLSETGSPSCFVDRSKFLQLQSATDSDSPAWPDFQVFALTSSLAAKPDVAASLLRQHWDLLLLLDTPLSTMQRWVDDLQETDTRVLWKLRPGYDLSTLNTAAWTIDNLNIREAFKDRGLPGGELPRMEFQIEKFEIAAADLVVEALIEQIIQSTKRTSAGRIAGTLRARWLSSPAALESGLRRVEAALNWQWPLWDAIEDAEDDVPVHSIQLSTADKAHALELINKCLEALDDLGSDYKLQRLVSQLKARGAQQSTCVFVRYRDTGMYLYSAIEDEGLECALIHGDMSPAEINANLRRFLQEPGQVLVMTTAMLIGIDMHAVRDLVLYDAPATLDVMSQVLARFHLFGPSPLRVTVIGDPYTANKTDELIQEAVRFVV